MDYRVQHIYFDTTKIYAKNSTSFPESITLESSPLDLWLRFTFRVRNVNIFRAKMIKNVTIFLRFWGQKMS